MRIEVMTTKTETYDVGTEIRLLSAENTTVLNVPTIYGNLKDMPLKDAEILATALKTIRKVQIERAKEKAIDATYSDADFDDDDE